MKRIPSLLLVLCLYFSVQAQRTFDIVIISDAAQNETHFFEENIQEEINALLGSRFALNFTKVYTNGNIATINEAIADVFAKNEADVLIGAGIISSKLLADQESYPIPTIATIQLVETYNTVSGVTNFTYIKTPFNIEDGIQVLEEICACEKLAVLTNYGLSAIGASGEDIFSDIETDIEWIELATNISSTVTQIPNDVGGVYILSPLAENSTDEIKAFLAQLSDRKLPSFSLFDDPILTLGGYASFSTGDNLQKIPRRIALNIEKITEGKDPKDFSVDIETFTNQLVINMETVNKVGI